MNNKVEKKRVSNFGKEINLGKRLSLGTLQQLNPEMKDKYIEAITVDDNKV